MRLRKIGIRDALPVRRFEVEDLSDIVVIAGPNGVGKSRLMQAIMDRLRGQHIAGTTGILEATSKDERAAWGKSSLDLGSPEDIQRLSNLLSGGQRKRTKVSSSLINFESDRTVQTLQPLPPSWDWADPADEGVGWDLTFQPLKTRYQDTVHAMHRMVDARRRGLGVAAEQAIRAGKTEMKLESPDPMIPFRKVFRQLLAPKDLADLSMGDQRLKYVQNGETRDFETLSSGEREVVNIAFDFLLRGPRDCIVFFDEPELHLHPELSSRLVQTLQSIGKNNQFIFTTHSPDIITASLDRSVVFLGPASEDSEGTEPQNQAIAVSDSDDTNQALKLLGQSIGIVALGRRIVLIEGANSSLDKLTYGSILDHRFPDLVMVASGGKHAIESFGLVHSAVLSKSLWGVDFFMLCDGDSRPAGGPTEDGRLQVLPRYQLENYFLDEKVWAKAFSAVEEAGTWTTDPAAIRAKLRELAREDVSYAVALKIAAEVRLRFGNVNVMPKACNKLDEDALVEKIKERMTQESTRLGAVLDETSVEADARKTFGEIVASLDADTETWKNLIPAKALLARFAAAADIKAGHAKKLYVDAARSTGSDVFQDIVSIFSSFSRSANASSDESPVGSDDEVTPA